VSGRADLILDEEGGRIDSLAIVDYKTATDERGDDFFGFQLAIYSSAALAAANLRATLRR